MAKKETRKKKTIKHKMSKKELEGYKRRNFIVEGCILFVVFLIVIFFVSNKTFIHTKYTHEIGGSKIEIEIPRFTYFVSDKDETITFMTLRKTVNTTQWFNDLVENEKYDLYYCPGDEVPYYYNSVGHFFIKNISVTKHFGIKKITIDYSTEDYDTFCNTVAVNEED